MSIMKGGFVVSIDSISPGRGRLVTADDIAQLLSVRPKWVYSACRLYDMPYYQVGRYKRFSPSEVMEWLEKTGVGRIDN